MGANAGTVKKGYASCGVHMGSVFHLLAVKYPTLKEMVLEKIQNMIDAGATTISLYINYERRVLTIEDDGEGADKSKFERALAQIGKTMKDDSKLGRFGIGLISPLGKCEEFVFVSASKLEGVYRQWRFVSDEIRSKPEVEIPYEELKNLKFSRERNKKPSGKTEFVSWRTQVRIKKFTDQKIINKIELDSLASEIRERYGIAMKRNGVVVNIDLVTAEGKAFHKRVEARDIEGKKLPDIVIENKEAGKTLFRLYLANAAGDKRNGRVLFGEIGNDFRINPSQFRMSTLGILDQEVGEALFSGTFAGEIISEKIELHPSRKSFMKNDALVGLCLSISEWYERHGRAYADKVGDEQRKARYKKSADEALHMAEKWLAELSPEEKKSLLDFKIGSVGKGHVKTGREIGEQDMPTKSHISSISIPKKEEGGQTSGERQEPTKEKEKHIPFTVEDDGGHQRTEVRKNSLGLTITFGGWSESENPYRFDGTRGIIEINTENRLFTHCENNSASALREYQFHVVRVALLANRYEKSFPTQAVLTKNVLIDDLKGIVFSLVNAKKLQKHYIKE